MEYQHIVGLMDGSGTRVVEYTYDAWGKLISATGTLANTLGADNPFRYRGYYYDAEAGLYYLMTRYYDPEVCRFISADVYMTTGQGVLGGNMWAYCGNNPVNRADSQGEFAILGTIVAGVVSVVVAGVFGGLSSLASGESFGAGFVSGAVTATVTVAAIAITVATGGTAGAVIAAGVIGGAVGGFAGYGAECIIISDKEFKANEARCRVLVSGRTGALSGRFTSIAGNPLVFFESAVRECRALDISYKRYMQRALGNGTYHSPTYTSVNMTPSFGFYRTKKTFPLFSPV